MKGLFLDDERNPEDVTWALLGSASKYPSNIEWTVVRTRSEFIQECETGKYTHFSFDHDIQDFSMVKKGTLIGISALGNVYQEEDMVIEHTGLSCASDLQDYVVLGLGVQINLKAFYVHSRNPVGAKKILNLLNQVVEYLEK